MAYNREDKWAGKGLSYSKSSQQHELKCLVDIKNETADLYSKEAERVVIACSQSSKKNKPTQIRRFYDELVHWHEKVYLLKNQTEREKKFKDALPYIQMLRAKVAYAMGRNLVDEQFKTFFDNLIDQIRSVETLRRARFFMEAFMGYKKGLEK